MWRIGEYIFLVYWVVRFHICSASVEELKSACLTACLCFGTVDLANVACRALKTQHLVHDTHIRGMILGAEEQLTKTGEGFETHVDVESGQNSPGRLRETSKNRGQ